jgi:NAD(P)-dependent dehydrogenase (short-subunit alcohol dehydrogenase family)
MKIDLSGKTAIVTGSTGGIDLAIVRGLAGCGARSLSTRETRQPSIEPLPT